MSAKNNNDRSYVARRILERYGVLGAVSAVILAVFGLTPTDARLIVGQLVRDHGITVVILGGLLITLLIFMMQVIIYLAAEIRRLNEQRVKEQASLQQQRIDDLRGLTDAIVDYARLDALRQSRDDHHEE